MTQPDLADIDSETLRVMMRGSQCTEAAGQGVSLRHERVAAWLQREEERHEAGEPVRLRRYRKLAVREAELRRIVDAGRHHGAIAFAIKRELIRRGEWP